MASLKDIVYQEHWSDDEYQVRPVFSIRNTAQRRLRPSYSDSEFITAPPGLTLRYQDTCDVYGVPARIVPFVGLRCDWDPLFGPLSRSTSGALSSVSFKLTDTFALAPTSTFYKYIEDRTLYVSTYLNEH